VPGCTQRALDVRTIVRQSAREQWVDGLPTLDVGDPYHLPYTSEGALREAENENEDADAAVMSVEQAFDFLGMLPL
jgi:hypothetical protein